MTTAEIDAAVKGIVADELKMEVSEVVNETNISANLDNLVMKFEEEFDIVIPVEERDFQTVSEAVAYIDNVLNG